MITALMVLQAIVSVLLIASVLLQFGKGAEAGLISGGASEAVFSGSQQGNILTKITAVLAVIFMANSITLAKLQAHRTSKSILDSEAPVARPLNTDQATKDAATTTPAAATEAAPATTPAATPAATTPATK